MNLAFEYFIRAELGYRFFRPPCSLFLRSNNSKKRIVVTIRDDANAFLVHRWYLNKCNPEQELPEYSHIRINSKDDLFSSSSVVMPGYSLIHVSPCRDSYVPIQGESMEDITHKQLLYARQMLNIWNPSNHKLKRKSWLWNSFIDGYELHKRCDLDRLSMYFAALGGSDALRYFKMPEFGDRWNRWLAELDLNGPLAAELVFWNAYDRCQKAA